MSKQYTTRTGLVQYKPSFKQVQNMEDNMRGFCLACGKTQSGVEPDARKYECEHCGKPKVYGPEELVLMGLVY